MASLVQSARQHVDTTTVSIAIGAGQGWDAPTPGNTIVLQVFGTDPIWPSGFDERLGSGDSPGPHSNYSRVATKVADGSETTLTVGFTTSSFYAGMLAFELSDVAFNSAVAVSYDDDSLPLPDVTPGAGEAFLLAGAVWTNAYNKASDPSGYTFINEIDPNAGFASARLNAWYRSIPSASGAYGGTVTAVTTVQGATWQLYFTPTDPAVTNADFTGTPRTVDVGEDVDFTDTSSNSPTSWAWDFGDGATSTSQNPTHAYAATGYYTVSLTATNASGSDTETKVAYIHVVAALGLTSEVYELIPPGDTLEFVGVLSEARDKAFRPVRNEPGSGTFTINRYSDEATATILKPGNLVRCIVPQIDPDAIFAWFMEKGDFNLVSTDEEGGEDITIGGRGVLSYWERAIWLSEKFTIPWWDPSWGTPPTGARGHVTFVAGTYRRYTIAGGVITGYTVFTTAGFEAYFDSRRTYDWPSENSKRFLVHIMAGETNAGWYVHPHQDGVTETLPSQTVGTSTSVLLSDISPDTPGAILYHLYLEANDPARPTHPIPLMTVDFDDTTDSNGDPWATTDALAGLTAELGETYLDTIVKLLSTGVIDVEMGPNLDMHAYNSQGRDLTGTSFGAGKVRFVKGVNIADELRREREDNPVATFVEVVGTDNVTGRATLPDAATRVAREISATGDSDDEDVLEALGLALLNARLISSDAIGFRIATGDDDAAGLYLPGPEGTDHGDFWLGDIVTLHTGTGEQDFDNEDERVFAISIAQNEGDIDVTPEVGSVLGEAERRLFAGVSSTRSTAAFTERSIVSDTQVAETDPAIDAHVGDATDAHDASAISYDPTASGAAATDVQAALDEVFAGAGSSGPWIYPETYGAVGDDTTDDTAALQAAIDAAEEAGGTIVLAAATYKITDELYVNPSGSVTGFIRFVGMGGGQNPASVIRQATANKHGIHSGANEYELTLENVWLKGPAGGTTGHGIYGNNRGINTHDVRIDGFAWGVRQGGQSYYSRHWGSMFYNNASGGVWLETGANNGHFVSCRFTTNGTGLRIDGAQSLKVFGGAYEDNTGVGIEVDTNGGQTTDGTLIQGAYFEGNGSACIRLGNTGSVRATTIIGCFFTSPMTGYFIDVKTADYVTIGGCGFLGTPTLGDIRLQTGITHAVQFNNRPSGAGNTYTSTPIILENLGTPAFATPAIALGTAAAAGAASTVIRSDATIVAFDGTVPVSQNFGDTAATGSASVAARRDHVHGMPASPATGSGTGSDHEHMVDQFVGDGSTTSFELTDEPSDPEAVVAFVAGAETAVTIGGAMNTTATFGAAPGAAARVIVQYPATAA